MNEKRTRVEFIESYWKDGNTDYIWNDNHGELIRCKDCKHMTEHYDTDGNVPYWTCSEWDSGTDYDGYCHYGERKEINKNG